MINNFCNTCRRLREVMDVTDPFGGLSIICVGDFYQLPPVKAPYIFAGQQAPHLWRDNFKGENL